MRKIIEIYVKFMYWLILKMIRSRRFTNSGKFREGDKVKFNWRAKYFIPSVYYDSDNRGVFTIKEIHDYKDGTACAYFDNNLHGQRLFTYGSVDVFWLTKA